MLKELQLAGHLAANSCLPEEWTSEVPEMQWGREMPTWCPFLGEMILRVGPAPKP